MSTENEFKVTSEILPFFEIDKLQKPIIDEKNVISKFTFTCPTDIEVKTPEKDLDGDYILDRGNSKNLIEKVIYLEHSVSTEIKLVGLQIWRAALLLSDFIIYSQKLFEGKTVLELGSGVGLTSIVAGMFAKEIISTDLDTGNILKLLESNLKRNSEIIKGKATVEKLDFLNSDNWSPSFCDKVKHTDIIIAADVIYDNTITEAFIKTITKILSSSPKKTLFIGLEKRYVFTISDLDSVAPCYEHFMSCLKSAQNEMPFKQWTISEMNIDFPQYFNYERTKQLIMFKITT
ncbi:conserved hypothetical protein [Pediculus humanus corporis]|uniref:Methyltransferase-like protein 22 n=1 Tax=Pediculus humanus subsp. corporis TaxID=121224 RepID=E0VGK4_PEDHC|nr:uncharacterized protein Phum_PHUM186760 [Pediculus humanus corporis]EEB12510.1 conserved hypothetical protein [Pediculus humanus corporis]